jgi:dGTPase
MLESYACDPKKTRGRLYEEGATPYRNEFQRDRDRVIHSNAFRRLEYKTQVFINHYGDHYRNRLTHSLEVSVIARSLARALNLSEDLAEGIALSHDLGHTPFGHSGEDALKECMKDYGGFSHNAQVIKILTFLENRYANFNGLNLTWEFLEGIAKHNGPLISNIPKSIEEYNKIRDLDLKHYSSAESQLASLADDIAYVVHDLEDGVRSKLLTIQDLRSIDVLNLSIDKILSEHPNLPPPIIIYEVGRDLTHILIEDLLETTRSNIKNYKIKTDSDVRKLGKPLVDFSEGIKILIIQVKALLFKNVYKHHKVVALTLKCQRIVKELFHIYFESPLLLPEKWNQTIKKNDDENKAIVIADYISGMTDRYAIKEYQSFFNINFKPI